MPVKKSKALLLRQYLYENEFNSVSCSVLPELINAIASPIFTEKEEINIIYKFSTGSDIASYFNKNILSRLKFLNTKIFDITNENIENINVFIISTKQYSACLLFDFPASKVSDEVVFSSFFNSKKTEEILKILLPDEKFYPERRENKELNEAILKLIKLSENSYKELSINQAEKNNLENMAQNLKRDEYLAKKSRYISHEIKNHLSVIDVYTKISETTCSQNKTVLNASNIIFNSIKNITKLLDSLKTFAEADLNIYDLKNTVYETAASLIEPAKNNNIDLQIDLHDNLMVVIDKDKFQNVILNLIKNAIEAQKNLEKTDKYIRIASRIIDDKISLTIENNGEKIAKKNQNKIFEEGFTTKSTGSGLGLYICKQNLEEQFCELSLLKSTDLITVFEIKMNMT